MAIWPDYSENDPPGTRFLLYPQSPFLEPNSKPELVEISAPQGTIGPGPSGPRMYAMYPVDKTTPYGAMIEGEDGPEMYLPAWDGYILPPPEPDVTCVARSRISATSSSEYLRSELMS